MTRAAVNVRWPMVAAAGGVLLAIVLAGVLLALSGGQDPVAVPAVRTAVATVVESAPCARPAARDTVVFVIDGWSYRLPLDACGNPEGIRIDVELVRTATGDEQVRLAGTGTALSNVAAERAGAVLLVLAGLAGALMTMVLWPHPAAVPAARAVAARVADQMTAPLYSRLALHQVPAPEPDDASGAAVEATETRPRRWHWPSPAVTYRTATTTYGTPERTP